MKLPSLLVIAVLGWIALFGSMHAARHFAGRAEQVADRLHWSTITGVRYPFEAKRPT